MSLFQSEKIIGQDDNHLLYTAAAILQETAVQTSS